MSFGVFDNQTAATLVTGISGAGALVIFVADAIIRANRAKMHGQQLLLYAVGKIEQLTAQGVDPKVINAAAAAVAGYETTPPVADTHPQPGDVDYLPPPGTPGAGQGTSPRSEVVSAAQPAPEPAQPPPPPPAPGVPAQPAE